MLLGNELVAAPSSADGRRRGSTGRRQGFTPSAPIPPSQGDLSMVRRLAVYLLLFLPSLLAAPLAAQTTSTLAAETGDNTSVGSFPTHDNGNVAAGNVSKIDTHTLLYPGATT